MPFPVSSTWNLADFSGGALGTLLTLPPSEVYLHPSGAPYGYSSAGALTVNSTGESYIDLDIGVPAVFTVEVTLRCSRLPPNTGDLSEKQLGFTVADDAGRGISTYISAHGLAVSRVDDYGSVTELDGTADLGTQIRSAYTTIRLCVDSSVGRAYVLLGDAEVTPQVQYILPVGQTPAGIGDRFRLSFYGSSAVPVVCEILAVRLASSLVLPDQPPVANAGADRVLALGQAVRFDGRASFDTEGAPLTYLWELVDAPTGSQYAAENSSGATTDDGDGDGATTILTFTPNSLPAWVAAGSILGISDQRYRIATVNNAGGQLTVDTEAIPDNLTAQPFRIFRQSFLVGADTETPYALPDKTGIYRVRLTVNDGLSDSEPSEVLASVVAARAPLGVEPDVSPLWGLLGDEWQYIENRGIFEEAWKGVAQILSGKLLEVWQHQYNNSIRDAQGTFQRKWMKLIPFISEASPDTATFSPRYGVLRAGAEFDVAGPSLSGTTLVIQYETATGPQTVSTTFGAVTLDGAVTALNAALAGTEVYAKAHAVERLDPSVRHEGTLSTVDDGDSDRVTPTLSVTPGSLPSWIAAGDIVVCDNVRSTVSSFNNGTGTITVVDDVFQDSYSSKPYRIYRMCRLSLYSEKPFMVSAASTAAALLDIPTDTYAYRYGAGSLVTARTYFAGDGFSWDVEAEDLLVLNNGQTLRVERTVSGPLDAYPNQRLLLLEDLPADASETWILPSVYRTDTDFSLECVYPGDLLRIEATTTDEIDIHAEVVGITTSSLGVIPRSTFWGTYLQATESRPLGVLRRNAVPIPEDVLSIPVLQDKIPVGSSPTYWTENVEYTLENFYRDFGSAVPVVQFRSSTFVEPDVDPPDALWAELVVFDNSTNIENLFGTLVGFLRDDAASFPDGFNYASGVAGLMYSQLRGPAVEAIRTGVHILLGQPFAEFSGTIEEVRFDFSPLRGRITIRDANTTSGIPSEIVRTYYYRKDPLDLSDTSGLAINDATGLPWAVGDSVPQFALLGSGVSLIDTQNDPDWFIPYVRSGIMSELEKFHTFLVEFNLDLVTLANLELLQAFVMRTKPTYTHPLLVGARLHADDLDLVDDLLHTVQVELLDAISGDGPALHYDDFRGDGTLWTSYDDSARYDKRYDTPLDLIDFIMEVDWAGGTIAHDSIFFHDTSVVDVSGVHTGTPGSSFSPTHDLTLPAGTYIVTVEIKNTGVVP